MREIKFRAWSKCGKYLDQVCEMTWTVGGLRAAGAGVYFCGCKERWSEKDLVGEHIILEQFTGLKDSNGKEIFEGDILRWDDSKDNGFSSSGGVHTEAAKYDNGEWRLGEFYGLPMVIENEYATVIGNIHENPELL